MENKKNITVFGATGQIGRELLRHLATEESPIMAVSRQKNETKLWPGMNWAVADLADKSTLYKTMRNSRSVFILSGHSPRFIEEQNNVIEVAKEQGIEHIVKLSSGAADKNSPFHIAKVHGEVEELLKASGISWTILRPNGFMQNWLGELALTVKKERKIYEATGDGKRAYIDTRDISEVAFKVLTQPQNHLNKHYFLTGSEAVNYKQVAGAISQAIGEQVEFLALSMEEARLKMEQKGMPPFVIQALLAYADDQRKGKTELVSGHVQEILNKPARTVETFARDHCHFFK